MGARELEPGTHRTTTAVLRAERDRPAAGWSRRQLLRRAVGAGLGLWLVEMGAGTIGWLWSAVSPQATFQWGAFMALLSVALLAAWMPWLRRGYAR